MKWEASSIHLNQIVLIDETTNEEGNNRHRLLEWLKLSAHERFYSHDNWGVRFAACENNFSKSVAYLNRKIDLHNLKVVRTDSS